MSIVERKDQYSRRNFLKIGGIITAGIATGGGAIYLAGKLTESPREETRIETNLKIIASELGRVEDTHFSLADAKKNGLSQKEANIIKLLFNKSSSNNMFITYNKTVGEILDARKGDLSYDLTHSIFINQMTDSSNSEELIGLRTSKVLVVKTGKDAIDASFVVIPGRSLSRNEALTLSIKSILDATMQTDFPIDGGVDDFSDGITTIVAYAGGIIARFPTSSIPESN